MVKNGKKTATLYVVCLCMLHYLTSHDMLKEFAADTGQTYGSVICCKDIFALLEDGSDIGIEPVLGDSAGLV